MKDLLHNIRFYVLTESIVLSFLIYLFLTMLFPQGSSQIAKLVQIYGLVSIVYLYLALLAGPFCYTFRLFPYRAQYLKARRAIGVSAFYFAFLHTSISLFGQLGGLVGLGFLSNSYLWSIGLGIAALFILFLLAITSFDFAVEKLTFPKWKLLHRFVYLAGIFVIVHTMLLGTHFTTLSSIIPQISFFALVFLFYLEVPRFDKLFEKIFGKIPQFGLSSIIFSILVGIVYILYISPANTTGTPSLSLHAAHIQLAQQAHQNNAATSNIPGLSGDRNKRYSASFVSPPNVQPNQDAILQFKIYEGETGNRVVFYRPLYSKSMHIIIVDSQLQYFSHIHPTLGEDGFSVTTQFPHPGVYHIYINFWPYGGIEQQFGFTQIVGAQDNTAVQFAKQPVDKNMTKTFGNYDVTLNTHGILQASAMSIGQQTISFTITDAKTKKPVTNLRPYLASFGHLTMISEEDYDFIHVHPYSIVVPKPTDTSGPTIDFLPLGIYGPLKPGTYRMFAEFNPDNKLFVSDFTVKVQ